MMPAITRPFARINEQPYALLAITALMWGGNVIAGRVAVGQISPMAVTCLRWLLVCLMLAATTHAKFRADWPFLVPHWRLLLFLGMTGFTVFNAMFYVAAHYTTGVNMAVLQGSFPIYVLLGAALVFGTRITLRQLSGVVLTILGVIVVATKGEPQALLRMNFNRGDLMMMATRTVVYAVVTLALRGRPVPRPSACSQRFRGSHSSPRSPFWPTRLRAAASSCLLPRGLLALAYTAIGPSLIGQVFYIEGVEPMAAARASAFYNLVPIFGALLSVVLLGESIHSYHALAVLLVIGGIWVAERR